jgi:hypothetical protein
MTNDSRNDRFGDDLDREVQPWQPEKDDKLVGRVLSVEWIDSRYSDEQYPYIELESVDGILYGWHAAQTVAKSAIQRKKLRAGDRLAVKYLGEHTKGYKDFRVLVEHADDVGSLEPVDELGDDGE